MRRTAVFGDHAENRKRSAIGTAILRRRKYSGDFRSIDYYGRGVVV
jgi:hypothetical protein